MARKALVVSIFLISLFTLVSSINGRKMLMDMEHSEVKTADARLYFTSLPKGVVPGSTPSKKGHATTIDEKLIARHLAAIDRILRSVPSPGVGH
ncbi:hypothetical protein F511_33749 [Dorcoceras hygrometricum]|uniref:Uncharacterized protein n=1 Tax=Dorcoceras hygrometricum TaxID=472368 RepID=A0A2Z7APG1_9LAMI|nr:hypothetical protein F511_33749 [Dorcoceras hygrometricum]